MSDVTSNENNVAGVENVETVEHGHAHVGVVDLGIPAVMQENYLDYALSVIMDRALPDVRDGLKPVHRRILYAMNELGMGPSTPYKKSARVVGDVIGKYHPHGDTSVYDAAVHMAQPWAKNITLVDGHGNFGSVDGDRPAAMRYTEMRLSRGGASFFDDINQDTVNFRPNYDGSEKEPEALPVAYPNLWVNGSEGIAVGMATRIAPHNMAETIEAVFLCLDKGDQVTDEDILAVMPGPDFPTGGIVHDLQGFRDALATGRGAVKIRSKWHPEKNKRGTTEYIVLDELPYQVNKANLVTAISLKAKEGILEDITDIRDESNKQGIRVVVELRKGASPEVVFHQLVRHSDVEVSYSYNVMVLDGVKPYQMGLRQILARFIDFRTDVIKRRTAFQLKKAEARLHILAGLMKSLDKLDDTIRTVRAHQRPSEASVALQALLQIDEIQAQSILDLKLQKLTGMELNGLRDEHREVSLKVADCKDILATPERVHAIMREDMIRVRDRFGVPRRTEISYETSNVSMADLVKKEPCLIHRTHSGYIKRMPLSDLGVQNRYTQGKSGISLTDNDYVEAVYTGCTHDMFMIFTKSGKCFARRVWQLPEGTSASRGRHLRNLFEDLDEPIAQMLFVPEMEIPDLTVVTATAKGKIKRTPLEEYRGALRKNGVQGIGLDEGDEIVGAGVCRNHDHLLLVTADGRALRFEVTEEATRLLSRSAAGVRGIKTNAESPLISMMVIPGNGQPLGFRKVMRNRIIDDQDVEIEVEEPDTLSMDKGWYLLCVGQNGVGKRTPVSEFGLQGRAGKGVNCFNINKKTGPLVRSALVREGEDLVLVTTDRSLRIRVADVRVAGRITAGTYLMDVTGESLVDVQTVPGELVETETETAQPVAA